MNVNTVVCRSQSFSTSNEEINANFISLAVLIVLLSYILCYKCTISLDLHFQNHIAVLYKYQLNGGAGKKVCIAIYVLGQHLGVVTCSQSWG